MALNPFLQSLPTLSTVGESPAPPGLRVVAIDFVDRMNDLFSLTVEINATDAHLDLNAFVGKHVVLELHHWGPLLPSISGIVRKMDIVTSVPSSPSATRVSKYRLHVVPPLWLLTQRVNHRIFHRLTTAGVFERVIEAYGALVERPQLISSGAMIAYSLPWEDRTQYGETDRDFLFRMAADLGVATYFDHRNNARWVLVDDTDRVMGDASRFFPVPYLPADVAPANPSAPRVSEARASLELRTSSLELMSYDHEDPATKPSGRARAVTPTVAPTSTGAELSLAERSLSSYYFRTGVLRRTDSDSFREWRAGHLLDALRAARRRAQIEINAPVGAGSRVRLSDHPRDEMNTTFLVTGTRFSWRDTGTESEHVVEAACSLDCIPADIPFRPAPVPPPRIIGTQTAVVVPSAAGQEIHADPEGQVMVKFHWDLRPDAERTTRYIRVSQGWAGPNYGFVCLPRVGDEVIVDFIDGDPDEPIIVGRVHNLTNPRPYNSSSELTISVWRSRSSPHREGPDRYNQILFDDRSDAERLELHAERDYRSETGHDSVTTVTNDETVKVGGNSRTTIAGSQSIGTGSTSISTGPYSLSARTITAKATRDVEITGVNSITENSLNHFIETKGFWVKADSDAQIVTDHLHVFSKKVVFDVGGASFLEMTPGGIKLKSSGPIEIEGSAIKLKSAGLIEIHGGIVDVKGMPIKLNT
ncbi:type VI secretion system tip protein TssI/VgrG [Sorangium sp. So ce269]